MVSVRNARQHAAANAAITWLLATDRAGNKFAMARRLGVMYIIYNNRMWGAWSGKWEQYNGCAKLTSRADDNACHRTHVHISLSWNGAFGRTTFWTKHVSATDYGPCRPSDLNWAYLYQHVNHNGCRSYAAVHAKKGASATKKVLVEVLRGVRAAELARPGGERGAAGVPPLADRHVQLADHGGGEGVPAQAPRLPGHRGHEPADVARAAGRDEVS